MGKNQNKEEEREKRWDGEETKNKEIKRSDKRKMAREREKLSMLEVLVS